MEKAVKATEEKFGTYWPRNILILFGPPGAGKGKEQNNPVTVLGDDEQKSMMSWMNADVFSSIWNDSTCQHLLSIFDNRLSSLIPTLFFFFFVGTHGPKIEDLLGIPQLSTGDMLRAAVSQGTEVGKKAEAIMKAGGLVSDEIVIGIIRDRIQEPDCKFGFILDGFPRTLAQAKALDRMLASEGARVTKVIELEVPDAVLEERITGRWIHKDSGRSYHVKYAPPKSMKLGADGKPLPDTMKDDQTGELLMQRKDDTADALIKRLKGYHGETVPILEHYRPDGIVRAVNANQGMDQVWTEILAALQRKA